ncbi:MAG: hypothetical protein HYS80_02780, partial [Candidatus Aenigmarchaeota archaeon]|nr:hypothetical protein [Candidatus Aenigmarchaeota archaeon]
LATGSQSETSCPNEAATYKATLVNEGNFRDTFSLEIDGNIKDLVRLSKDLIVLEPGQEQEIIAFVNSPAESGDYSFTLEAKNSENSRSVDFDLNVKSCYGYDLTLRRGDGKYSICEHSVIVVPLNINNKGTTRNKFNIELDSAPIWARLDKSSLDAGIGEAKTFNLVLAPDFGVVGNYTVEVVVNPERGDKKATATLDFEIRDCHSVDLDINSEGDIICRGLNNAYSINIENNGEVVKLFFLQNQRLMLKKDNMRLL